MDHMDASSDSFPTQPPERVPSSTPLPAPTQSASFAQPAPACASCGAPVIGAAAFCPTCGRPLAASDLARSTVRSNPWSPVMAPAGEGAYPAGDAPTVAGITTALSQPLQPYPPDSVGEYSSAANTWPGQWPGQYPPPPTGMAALGSGAPVTPTRLARPRRLRNFLAVVAAICIVALLGGSAYAIYAAFADSSQAAAKVLPDNTFVYASVDLTAAATNGHHVTLDDLAQTVGFASFVKAERLNWQTDITPWVGRNIAVAAYPVPGQSAASSVAALGATGSSAATSAAAAVASPLDVGVALLLQSRNDGAAQAAMAKSAHAQSASVKQFSYGGFTLYTVNNVTSATSAASAQTDTTLPAQTLTAGKGWAVIASSASAAETVVNRLNGTGATLANAAAFQDATSNLPNSRFGTMYVNLRAYYNTLLALAPSAAQAALDFPLIDTYPVAGGYFTWTTGGLRAQLTFNAVKGANIGVIGGDTTNLAALAPTNTTSYIGGANLGALMRAYLAQVPALAAGSVTDPLETAFGVSSSDPALQQPFALISFPVGKTTASAYLLHAPNAAAVQTILRTFASKSDWTLKATTVDGVAATTITAQYPTNTATGSITPGKASTSSTIVVGSQTTQVGVAAQIGQTFALVNSDDAAAALSAILAASQSAGASLGGSASFQALVSQAPGHAALTVYGNLAALREAHQPAGAQAAQGLNARVSGVLMTMVWNAQMNQTTLDIKLN